MKIPFSKELLRRVNIANRSTCHFDSSLSPGSCPWSCSVSALQVSNFWHDSPTEKSNQQIWATTVQNLQTKTSISAQTDKSVKFLFYPFKVKEVFFECFSGLSVHWLVCNVWILFVTAAFIVFTAVIFPICNEHWSRSNITFSHSQNQQR